MGYIQHMSITYYMDDILQYSFFSWMVISLETTKPVRMRKTFFKRYSWQRNYTFSYLLENLRECNEYFMEFMDIPHFPPTLWLLTHQPTVNNHITASNNVGSRLQVLFLRQVMPAKCIFSNCWSCTNSQGSMRTVSHKVAKTPDSVSTMLPSDWRLILSLCSAHSGRVVCHPMLLRN